MEFGLWFEPEMVNPDSDLFRAHPDWVLGVPGRHAARVAPPAGPRPRAPRRLRLSARALLHAAGARTTSSFLKWDHNRDLVEAPPQPVHAQTLARLPASRRAPGAPPGRRDRELRLRRRARRPRHPRAHRPRVGERHQRRARAPGDPALDRAAARARAHRRPRRAAARAHHRPLARALVPRRDRAVRPLRPRMGPQRGDRGGAGRARRGDRVLQAGARPPARRRGGARRPPRPGRLGPRRRR